MAKCTAIKRGGGQCKGVAIDGSQWCYAHHPDTAEARRRHASRGGKTGGRGRAREATTTGELDRLQHRFEELAEEVREGRLEGKTAAIIGQLLNYGRACLRDRVAAAEQEELVSRLEAIEAAADEAKRYGA